MEKQNIDGSKFLKGGIYDTPEDALLGVLQSPTKKSQTDGQTSIPDKTAENFVKSFFPGIQKPLQ